MSIKLTHTCLTHKIRRQKLRTLENGRNLVLMAPMVFMYSFGKLWSAKRISNDDCKYTSVFSMLVLHHCKVSEGNIGVSQGLTERDYSEKVRGDRHQFSKRYVDVTYLSHRRVSDQ